MRLSIKYKIFLGAMASVVALVAAINLATLKTLTDLSTQEKLQQFDNAVQSFQRFDAKHRELVLAQAQTLADSHVLKAALAAPVVERDTVSRALSQLKTSESVSAVMAFDANLELLAVQPKALLPKMKMLRSALFAQSLEGDAVYRPLAIDGEFYLLAAAPTTSGEKVVGALVVALRVDKPERLEVLAQVSGLDVALAFGDRVVGSANGFATPFLDDLVFKYSSAGAGLKWESTSTEVREVSLAGDDFFASGVAVGSDGQLLFYSTADLLPGTLGQLRQIMLVGSVLGLLLGILFSIWIALRVSRPLREVTEAAEKFRSGDLDARVQVNSGDELGQLSDSFNHMVDQFVRDQAQLVSCKEAAEEANRAKSTFLATMSHEIRTPLNGVLGMTEIISKKLHGTEHQRNLEIIRDSGNSLLEVINDILDFSKIEAGKLELSSSRFELRRFVAELCDNQLASAHSKGLELTSSLPPQVAFQVEADMARLRRVLTNLIGNAIKFTATGHVDVSVKLLEKRPGYATFRFEVSDTGIGIASDRIDQIFESFTQEDGSTTRQFGGTGLGLAISKQLVELMGGEIEVSSVPGRGSCFCFDLELKAEQVRESSARENRVATALAAQSGERGVDVGRATDTVSDQRAHCGTRVLLAEDAVVNQEVAQTMIRHYGCEVRIAGNGLKALELVENEHFDLIFMDCQMPQMDGYDATTQIRSREHASSLPRVPIVALTANAVQGDRERCLEVGMDDYIAKPFTNESIGEKLKLWLAPGSPV